MEKGFKINENAKLTPRALDDFENIYLDIKDEYGPTTPAAFANAILDYYKRQNINPGTFDSHELIRQLWNRFLKMYPMYADKIKAVKKEVNSEIVKERLEDAQSKPAPKRWKSGLEHRLKEEDDDDDDEKK